MSIWLYKKHPPHNLAGENYPHFRNEQDKYYWVTSELIDLAKKIELNITRVSFDTARLIFSCKKYQINGLKIAGIAEDRPDEKFYFWFVVGWSFGSNENVVIFELKLDYWLSFWPLKFNQALVRINRKHMNRFKKNSTQKNFQLNFNSDNRQLQIPEKTIPPNILSLKQAPPALSTAGGRLMIGIVFTPVGGEINNDNNYFTLLGKNNPGRQNGFLIFGHFLVSDINSWLSFPGITQSFYFFLNTTDIEIMNYKVTHDGSVIGKEHIGQYNLKIGPISTYIYEKLQVVKCNYSDDYPTTIQTYISLAKMIVRLTYLSRESRNDTIKVNHFGLEIKKDESVVWNFNAKFWKNAQLVSLKSFFRNGKATSKNEGMENQFIRGYENVYFTTINIFNNYMDYQQRKKNNWMKINFIWKEFDESNFTKTEKVMWLRKLKLWSNFHYSIGFQNQTQNIKPHLFTWKDGFNIKYNFVWYLTINNSYFIAEPEDMFLVPENKKYNLVFTNESTVPNYTDGSIEFFQKQGISFDTGINQAKFSLNWAKRYNQFQEREVPFEIFQGIVGSVAGNYFSGGLIGGKMGGYAGALYGAGTSIASGVFKEQEMKLQNEMREKKAYYALKQLQAKQADIFNQPTTTHANDRVEASYLFITGEIKPYLIVMKPTEGDLVAQAKLYHKFGNLNDQDEIVDLNNEWTRRCWNYWEIHNIEQAIVKDDLNHLVITFFNNLFNQGVRLWNVFFEEVKFNDYTLENWEQKILVHEK